MLLKYLGVAIAIGGISYGIISFVDQDRVEESVQREEPSEIAPKALVQNGSAAARHTDMPTKKIRELDTSVAITSPSDAGSAGTAVSVSIVDLDTLKDSYRDLTDDEIAGEISDLEAGLEEADLIARANANELSPGDMQDLSDRLQNLDALRLVKMERKLAKIKSRIRSRPARTTDEEL